MFGTAPSAVCVLCDMGKPILKSVSPMSGVSGVLCGDDVDESC